MHQERLNLAVLPIVTHRESFRFHDAQEGTDGQSLLLKDGMVWRCLGNCELRRPNFSCLSFMLLAMFVVLLLTDAGKAFSDRRPIITYT